MNPKCPKIHMVGGACNCGWSWHANKYEAALKLIRQMPARAETIASETLGKLPLTEVPPLVVGDLVETTSISRITEIEREGMYYVKQVSDPEGWITGPFHERIEEGDPRLEGLELEES